MPSQKKIGGIEMAAVLSLALAIDILQPMMLVLMPLMGAAATGWVIYIPFVGQGIAASAAMAGLVFSFIFDLFLTLVGLVFICGWLLLRGVPIARRMGLGAIAENIPAINYLPWLTLSTWLSIRAANREAEGKGGGVLSTALMLTPAGRALGGAALARGSAGAQQAARAQAASRGAPAAVRPQAANDNEERAASRTPRMSADVREPRPRKAA